MVSAIDVTQPTGTRVKSAETRANWKAAYDEITALQDAIANLVPFAGGQMTGPLLLATDPLAQPLISTDAANSLAVHKSYVDAGDAALKVYIDDAIVSVDGGDFLPLTGGVLTGATTIKATFEVHAPDNGWIDIKGDNGDIFPSTINIYAGGGLVTASGADVNLAGGQSGSASTGSAGDVDISGGRAFATAKGGDVKIDGGGAADGNGGHVWITTGSSKTGARGELRLSSLPQGPQSGMEAVWINNGVLNIGAGIKPPTAPLHAATKQYCDETFAPASTMVELKALRAEVATLRALVNRRPQ